MTNIIYQTNWVTNTFTNFITNTNTITNEITPVEIVNSGVNLVAIAQIATPFILVIWAGIDQTRKKKERRKINEETTNRRIQEYKYDLKKFILFIRKKALETPCHNWKDKFVWVESGAEYYLKQISNGDNTKEMFDLLKHLEIIEYKHYNYRFANMSKDDYVKESSPFFIHLLSVVDKIDSGEYDDKIRKYINEI